jgi:hypothetical protein
VNDELLSPLQGISNISEWAKRDACWTRMLEKMDRFAALLPGDFESELLSHEEHLTEKRSARSTQKLDNGIETQSRILAVPPAQWSLILREGAGRRLLTPKEIGILQIAAQMPAKIPTERQSAVLMEILGKARQEGIL